MQHGYTDKKMSFPILFLLVALIIQTLQFRTTWFLGINFYLEDIQLLPLHLTKVDGEGREGSSKCKRMRTGGRKRHVNANIFV